MAEKFVPITDYTKTRFKSFRAKTMLDFMAVGMYYQRRIEGYHTRTDRMTGGKFNQPKILPDGSSLRTERKSKGLTLAQLAELSGVGLGTISNIEIGRGKTTQETWDKVKGALDSYQVSF